MPVAHASRTSTVLPLGPFRRPRVRRVAVWAAAAIVAALALLSLAAGPARADEAAGYFTVSGVAGADEAAPYATLADALSAAGNPAPDGGATVAVHGVVQVEAGSYAFACPVDGAACALVGADSEARIEVVSADGSPLALANESGSLVVRGVSFAGEVRLSCRDGIALDSCSFADGVACSAGYSVSATGNVFASADGGRVALSAELFGEQASLTFTGNQVGGFACGVSVAADAPGAVASATSNSFSLAADPTGAVGRTAALRLAGGPWPVASVVLDGNAVAGAEALVVLDATFSAYASAGDGAPVEAVSDGTLSAATAAALFELVAGDAAGLADGVPAVALDAAYDGSDAAACVAEGASLLVQPVPHDAAPAADGRAAEPVADAPAAVTVTYDANGATGGAAPAAATVEAGASVAAETMGTLVYAGYVFEGWNTAPDGSGVFYAAGQVFVPEADTVLYAQWAPTGTVATMSVAAVDTVVVQAVEATGEAA